MGCWVICQNIFLIFKNLFYLLLDAQSKTSKHAIGFVAHCMYLTGTLPCQNCGYCRGAHPPGLQSTPLGPSWPTPSFMPTTTLWVTGLGLLDPTWPTPNLGTREWSGCSAWAEAESRTLCPSPRDCGSPSSCTPDIQSSPGIQCVTDNYNYKIISYLSWSQARLVD